MLHKDVVIRECYLGQGLFATKPIKKGTVVWTLESALVKTFSQAEFDSLPEDAKVDIKHFAIYNNKHYIYYFDNIKFINHSCSPNTLDGNGGKMIIANKDLEANEEITSDYRTDYDVLPFDACKCNSCLLKPGN